MRQETVDFPRFLAYRIGIFVASGGVAMNVLIVCRTCGRRKTAELAAHQQELVLVGMLETRCDRCASQTRWGRAEDYRGIARQERRSAAERRLAAIRRNERRTIPRAGADRRRRERRTTPARRKGARRRG